MQVHLPAGCAVTARNRIAAARGARTRELIRQILIQHAERSPLGRPLTAKQIQWHLKGLGVYLAPSTIAWHVNRIRLAADIEALDAELGCKGSDLSGEFRGAS
jgi:hypothetical protein